MHSQRSLLTTFTSWRVDKSFGHPVHTGRVINIPEWDPHTSPNHPQNTRLRVGHLLTLARGCPSVGRWMGEVWGSQSGMLIILCMCQVDTVPGKHNYRPEDKRYKCSYCP